MSFNLHNRSLLALKDFAPDEVRYLLDLAADKGPLLRASGDIATTTVAQAKADGHQHQGDLSDGLRKLRTCRIGGRFHMGPLRVACLPNTSRASAAMPSL